MDAITALFAIGAAVEQERYEHRAYVLTFSFVDAVTTVRIILEDYSGADLVITNMTTLPDSAKSKGYGSKALTALLEYANTLGFKDVRAVQVQKQSERFWVRNGFVKMPEPNACNDYHLQNR